MKQKVKEILIERYKKEYNDNFDKLDFEEKLKIIHTFQYQKLLRASDNIELCRVDENNYTVVINNKKADESIEYMTIENKQDYVKRIDNVIIKCISKHAVKRRGNRFDLRILTPFEREWMDTLCPSHLDYISMYLPLDLNSIKKSDVDCDYNTHYITNILVFKPKNRKKYVCKLEYVCEINSVFNEIMFNQETIKGKFVQYYKIKEDGKFNVCVHNSEQRFVFKDITEEEVMVCMAKYQ